MEIEIKYMIDSKETAERLWEDKALTKMEEPGSREKLFMKAAYFDTEDLVLSRNDIAFRVRMEGARVVACLKWGSNIEGSLHTREEINVPVNDLACFITPDIEIFRESDIGKELLNLIDGEQLQSIMEVGMLRSRFRIDTGTSIVEVSIDNGEIVTDYGTAPICEVELELFSGDTEELQKLGADIYEKYNLKEGLESKYARGLALVKKGKN